MVEREILRTATRPAAQPPGLNIKGSPPISPGMVLVGLGVLGSHYAFSTLPLAVCVTVGILAWNIVRRAPRTLLLIDFWVFGFVYLFGSEVLLARSDVLADFGDVSTGAAEGFIVAAF